MQSSAAHWFLDGLILFQKEGAETFCNLGQYSTVHNLQTTYNTITKFGLIWDKASSKTRNIQENSESVKALFVLLEPQSGAHTRGALRDSHPQCD